MRKTFTSIVMFLNIFVLVGLYYLMFWPVPLAEIYNEPFPVTPQEVKRGETLYFTIDFEKRSHYTVTSHRAIICKDGNLVTLANHTSNTHAPLGRHQATIGINLPDKVSNGECYIQLENTYDINPLREEHRTMRTQDFTVIE